jgi:hypothetical protein
MISVAQLITIRNRLKYPLGVITPRLRTTAIR